jgi:hypothetical protein
MSGWKKGTFPASEKQIAAAMTLVAKAKQELADVLPMKKAERQQAVKLRTGTAIVVPAIKALVEKYELQTKHVSLDDSSSRLAYASTLRGLLAPVEALQQLIKDEILRAEAAAWTSVSVSYGMLQKVAIAVPALATDLAPVEAWFRSGQGRKPAPADPAPTAPVVNPPATA